MQSLNPQLSYVPTLHPLNFKDQGTEVLYAEAANGEFNLNKTTGTNVRQDDRENRTQHWEEVDLDLNSSSLSHWPQNM